ncbi:MAG: hypothetical protein HKN13_10535, partial [Rhodothermales bacterium]|nr:hypothetical protein [Rhodothermales bacterium]
MDKKEPAPVKSEVPTNQSAPKPTLDASRSDVDRRLVQHAEPSVERNSDFRYTKRLKREILKRAGLGLLHEGDDVTHPVYHRGALFVKRTIDIAGSITAIVLLAPVWILVAILVKLTSKGPILFVQDRVGQQGKWVRTLKFRTMVVNAEQRLQDLLDSDPELRKQYEQFHKLESDPRVTPVGEFLRRHSLDELPQFLNVLGGSMSLVGPRGYLAYEVMKLKDMDRILKV